jgi:hypothetical protein
MLDIVFALYMKGMNIWLHILNLDTTMQSYFQSWVNPGIMSCYIVNTHYKYSTTIMDTTDVIVMVYPWFAVSISTSTIKYYTLQILQHCIRWIN